MTQGNKTRFIVLGAGSWGTALSLLLSRNGHPVCLWAHDADFAATLNEQRSNERYLPGIAFPDLLSVNSDLAQCFAEDGEVLVVVPSSAFRSCLDAIKPFISDRARLCWATKGLEQGSNKLLHEVVADVLPHVNSTAVLSGPTFAREVAQGLPTAITVASSEHDHAAKLASCLHSKTFRAYTSDDIIGVELGGAVKNVLAIATGVADGLGFGANTRAALVTRGLAEMIPLGEILGGRRETFMGLAGLGDLVLTCTDNQSRNRRLGLMLGEGKTLEQSLASIDQVVEGVQTTREIHELAQVNGIEMPIVEQVFRVLYDNCPPKEAVHALLEREQKEEKI